VDIRVVVHVLLKKLTRIRSRDELAIIQKLRSSFRLLCDPWITARIKILSRMMLCTLAKYSPDHRRTGRESQHMKKPLLAPILQKLEVRYAAPNCRERYTKGLSKWNYLLAYLSRMA